MLSGLSCPFVCSCTFLRLHCLGSVRRKARNTRHGAGKGCKEVALLGVWGCRGDRGDRGVGSVGKETTSRVLPPLPPPPTVELDATRWSCCLALRRTTRVIVHYAIQISASPFVPLPVRSPARTRSHAYKYSLPCAFAAAACLSSIIVCKSTTDLTNDHDHDQGIGGWSGWTATAVQTTDEK